MNGQSNVDFRRVPVFYTDKFEYKYRGLCHGSFTVHGSYIDDLLMCLLIKIHSKSDVIIFTPREIFRFLWNKVCNLLMFGFF